jgi:hypothetical protein
MEPKFQQTFIPKKPVVTATPQRNPSGRHPIGILPLIAWAIFILTILTAVGLFVYSLSLEKNIQAINTQLVDVQKSFDSKLIAELKSADDRLKIGKKLLENHIAVSPLFSLLEDVTLQTVRFNNFQYTNTDGKAVIGMAGEAAGYNALALQSDIIDSDVRFISPLFSGINLNDAGNVIFTLQSQIDSNVIKFVKPQTVDTTNTTSGAGGQQSTADMNTHQAFNQGTTTDSAFSHTVGN